MQFVLSDVETRAPLELHLERPMDDDAFFAFCLENSDLRIEREANGDITIMPPTGPESSHRNLDLSSQLHIWSRRDGRGQAFGPDAEFFLPTGAAYGPDACWVHNSRLAQFTKDQKRRFLYLCPDFVIELMSPSDRLSKAQSKMRQWIENGAALAWLIDADQRTVYIYRPGREPELLVGPDHVNGEGPVAGFRLELSDIWRGL
jgi:Uma2 family endonuclease